MAKESSLAPKERINVTFRPATGGAQEEIELPLKVMVVGDFLQRYDDRPLIDRKPVSVNKNNFADVMAKQNLTVQLSVRNRLTDSEDPGDFEPEGIARQIPEMNGLLKLRDALISLKGPLGNAPAFRAALEEVLHDERQRRQIMDELRLSDTELTDILTAAPKKSSRGDAPERSENADSPADDKDR